MRSAKTGSGIAVPAERIENRILDSDLAALYGVETRVFNQAVKRNLERFPGDFMFRLSAKELESWRSQFVMSNPGAEKDLRRPPLAFTEHGALMAATILDALRTFTTASEPRKQRSIGFVLPEEKMRT